MRKRLLILVGAGLLVLGATQASWAQKGGVWDLGTYPHGTWADPRGINNAGVIVGSGDIASGDTRAIGVSLHGPGSLDWFDLGTLGGDDAFPGTMCMGVADTGLIVGHSFLPENPAVHAFAWTHRSGMVDIGTLRPEHSDSYAYNVNRAGTLIVGWSGNGWWPENSRPVVWTPSRAGRHDDDDAGRTWKIHELDTTGFRDATNWTAIAVNNRGQIVGWAIRAGIYIPVIWNPAPDGVNWRIAALPILRTYPHAWPDDINEEGQIVGGLASATWETFRAVLWQPMPARVKTWAVTVLPALSGATVFSEAMSINDRGDIVGYAWDANYMGPATRWSAKDTKFVQSLEDLGFPAGDWSSAAKVNDSGIVAGGYGDAEGLWERTVALRLRQPERQRDR
jgi:probable HAF family extracellular repeat protein